MSLYCSEPRPPGCIEQLRMIDAATFSDRCRDDLRRYLGDVERFTDCLERETKSMVSEAREEADKTVKRFHCKLEKRVFCF